MGGELFCSLKIHGFQPTTIFFLFVDSPPSPCVTRHFWGVRVGVGEGVNASRMTTLLKNLVSGMPI